MNSLFEIEPDERLFYSQKDSMTAHVLGIPMYFSEKVLDSLSFYKSYESRFSLYIFYYQQHKTEDANTAVSRLDHPENFLNRWLHARAKASYKILYDPSAIIDYIVPNIPFFLFFFSPLFAIFFWLLYSRKRHTYMEHIIFIFHIFSFIFLASIIFLIPDFFLDNFFTSIFFYIIGPIYFHLALKKFYGQSKLVTLIKFVILNIIFNIGLFVATMLFVAGSAAIY